MTICILWIFHSLSPCYNLLSPLPFINCLSKLSCRCSDDFFPVDKPVRSNLVCWISFLLGNLLNSCLRGFHPVWFKDVASDKYSVSPWFFCWLRSVLSPKILQSRKSFMEPSCVFGTSEQTVLAKMVKIHYWFWVCQLGQFRGQNKGKKKDEERVLILKCDIACTTMYVVGVSPWDSPEGIRKWSKGTCTLFIHSPLMQ